MTSSSVIPAIRRLYNSIVVLSYPPGSDLARAQEVAIQELDKRWKVRYRAELLLATVLDPFKYLPFLTHGDSRCIYYVD